MPNPIKLLIAVPATLHVATASPIILRSPPHALTNTILGTTGIHSLVDCIPLGPSPSSTEAKTEQQTWLSLVIYCATPTQCNDPSHVPAAQNICVKRSSNVSRDWHKWENSDWQHCSFPNATTGGDSLVLGGRGVFSWVIGRFGRLFPPATEVG